MIEMVVRKKADDMMSMAFANEYDAMFFLSLASIGSQRSLRPRGLWILPSSSRNDIHGLRRGVFYQTGLAKARFFFSFLSGPFIYLLLGGTYTYIPNL